MYTTMKLILMYLDKSIKEIYVRKVWQQRTNGDGSLGKVANKIYYETFNDEFGKGTFVDLSDLRCWEVELIRN